MEKLAISIEEFASMVGIGRSKAYQLSRSEGFPQIRLGKRIVIPVDQLKDWLMQNSQKMIENEDRL